MLAIAGTIWYSIDITVDQQMKLYSVSISLAFAPKKRYVRTSKIIYEHNALVTGCCQYTEQQRDEVKHTIDFTWKASDGVATARCEHSMMTRLTLCK